MIPRLRLSVTKQPRDYAHTSPLLVTRHHDDHSDTILAHCRRPLGDGHGPHPFLRATIVIAEHR